MDKSDRLIRLKWNPSSNEKASSTSTSSSSSSSTLADYFAQNNIIKSRSDIQFGISDGNGKTDKNRPVVLVGKGVCYDTGGINLKKGARKKIIFIYLKIKINIYYIYIYILYILYILYICIILLYRI